MLLGRMPQNSTHRQLEREKPTVSTPGKDQTLQDKRSTISPPLYNYSQSHIVPVEQTEVSAEEMDSSYLVPDSVHSTSEISVQSDSPLVFQSPPDPQERQVY